MPTEDIARRRARDILYRDLYNRLHGLLAARPGRLLRLGDGAHTLLWRLDPVDVHVPSVRLVLERIVFVREVEHMGEILAEHGPFRKGD